MKKIIDKNTLPELSVIVISVNSYNNLINCLESILANTSRMKIEIVVVDSGSAEKLSSLQGKYPQVIFLHFPEDTGPPKLSAAGIEHSSGELIALTDSTCLAEKNWLTAIKTAHQDPTLVIGGAVEIHGQRKLIDWAAYFCEYAQFMKPLEPGMTDVIPGNNITFKRSALAEVENFTRGEFWKTYWCQEIQKKGFKLTLEPAIKVFYTKDNKFSQLLLRRFHNGRCFAGMRLSGKPLSLRLFYAAVSIFLTPVFLSRIAVTVIRKKRFLKKFFFALPFILPAILSWSFGETCGYLAGTGKSCQYSK